jgi:tetraacyldisaccharide 4'-kinase
MRPGLSAPAFWWQPRPTLTALLLSPLSLVYGAISGARMRSPPRGRAAVPVVCIGNFVVGGTGKTPMALALAAMLRAAGERPVFLTRGFGGTLGREAPVEVDAQRHDAAAVGDEALLLARAAPTVVCADRVAGARLAEELGTIILMDDGFQNPALAKDLSLVLADASAGIGNGFCLPAGPLRAPMARQLPRADAVILVGAPGPGGDEVARLAAAAGCPVHTASLAAVGGRELAGRDVLAFAGIGRPEKFFASLREVGARVVVGRCFGDHHPYSLQDLATLAGEARSKGLLPVTTAKDMVRLAALARTARADARTDPQLIAFLDDLKVLEIRLVPQDGEGLGMLLGEALKRARKAPVA